ncbi:hypothetical protein AB0F72_07715 [Actinoplanes sp. NPDC023936]|uniref:hypothetical protein n=1 Tax=Actinoplanes sp. NPDC023936 TaxID=3154910 RepID=UPI0033D9C704
MSADLLPERADLVALDTDALAALANRGLVKRAAREVERDAPALSAGDGPVVVAAFGDGVRTELPAGGLDRARCSCGATTVCRHVIGAVLAYQAVAASTRAGSGPGGDGSGPGGAASSPGRAESGPGRGGSGPGGDGIGPASGEAGAGSSEAEAAASPATVRGESGVSSPSWSPGEFTDEEVTARIGSRLVSVARRAERTGYSARVRRGTVPVVELASATVRFLVPRDLGYVHTDARAGTRDDVIALAVWAFRAADVQHPGEAECLVDVGGAAAGRDGSRRDTGLEPVLEFAADVLRHGAVHAGEGLAAAVAGHLNRLERDGLRWPLDATAELAGQLAGYAERSARYSPETLADLLAELFARHRAVAAASRGVDDVAGVSGAAAGGGGLSRAVVGGGAGLRARVLGSEESAETPLRRVRLDGLGARVSAVDDRRIVEIFHAQAATGTVLVSQREWTAEDDGPALARRRLGGSTVGALAAGVVVTESAVRSASRAVRLATSRVARTTVTAGAGAWDRLPPTLLTTEYPRLAAEIDGLPPRPVRARVRAELVRVLAIAEVGGIHYAPGEQRLTVEIRDGGGVAATVTATHAGVAPGRIDAVLAALSGRHGVPRFVAGSVHRGGGGLVVDPYAIVADGPPIVPDLADPDREADRLGAAEGPGADPLTVAVARTREVLAEAAHLGLAHLPAAYPDRLREARQALARVGLHRLAGALDGLAATLGPDPGEAAVQAWVDAHLRAGATAELL